jgi:hypothetical protein
MFSVSTKACPFWQRLAQAKAWDSRNYKSPARRDFWFSDLDQIAYFNCANHHCLSQFIALETSTNTTGPTVGQTNQRLAFITGAPDLLGFDPFFPERGG